ncbi:MAG TPA: cystathionine beta-lyase [Vitreimonas sp.]|nr:cystathionine beta-lyase [Vitreimonas sp.]
MADKPDLSQFKLETLLVLAGRDPARYEGTVNPALQRATTLILDDVDELYGTPTKTYALDGMAVQEALMRALAAIESGADALLAPSGMAAVTMAFLTVARAGGEFLVTDACYGPTRRLCDTLLKKMGVKTRFVDPRIGAGIADLITDTTCGIFMESPGSITLEIMDVPAIAAAARAKNVPVILDNTWSAGVFFKPFSHGVDLSVQALTKYQAGHADAFMGAVVASTPQWANRVRATYKQLGLFASPDDAYLVLRGLRTLSVRLERQSASALKVATWLRSRAEVETVFHPALDSHPDHAMWARDFLGASGLFSVALNPAARERIKAMCEGYRVFAMGFSWGGYESLIVPSNANIRRSAAPWKGEGELLRLSIGLEHPDDLIADLEEGFARLNGG